MANKFVTEAHFNAISEFNNQIAHKTQGMLHAPADVQWLHEMPKIVDRDAFPKFFLQLAGGLNANAMG